MKILYHITSPQPRIPGTDALYQEVELLNNVFGGGIIRWYPFPRYSPLFPPFSYGFSNLVDIWKKEQDCDIHHIFHSIYYPFPLISLLRKPVVFTVAGSLAYSLQYAPRNKIHLILPSEDEKKQAVDRGWNNTSVVYPGIEKPGLSTISPPERKNEFVLFAGSAPWAKEQFEQKGFHLMLQVLKNNKNIRLITLWRGVLHKEWEEIVDQYGVSDRVEVYNTWIDIAEIMPRVHAAIVLSDRGGIVKAWPHSLLEALEAGRPVIVSRIIPIASFIREKKVGIVTETMEYKELELAIMTLQKNYQEYQVSASLTRGLFSSNRAIDDYNEIYTSILNKKKTETTNGEEKRLRII